MYLAVEDQTFGDKLRIAREQHNLTRVQLAEQIGSSSKTVARWERGETLPQPHFQQGLCASLNTTLQELGLETKDVTKEQKSSRIQQHGSSPATPTAPSMDEPKKRLTMKVSSIGTSFVYSCPLKSAMRAGWILITGETGCGKSNFINDFFHIDKHEKVYGTAPAMESINGLKYSSPNTSFPKDIGDKTLYGFFREKVVFFAHAARGKSMLDMAENLTSMYQYALISNFYEIILPAMFTIRLQIDIGEVVASLTNVAQVIHRVLSDPAWQGLGVVISIVLPFIMGYKKKSSPAGPFLSSISLAA
jgi:transcriptional regulator with XRE-family HTH domain